MTTANKKATATPATNKGTSKKATPASAKPANKGTAASHKAASNKADNKTPATPVNTIVPEKKDEVNTVPDVNIVDTNIPENTLKGQEGSLLDAAGTLLDNMGTLPEVGDNDTVVQKSDSFDASKFVTVQDSQIVITYPEPDFSTVTFPTAEEITQAASEVVLSEQDTTIPPLTALKTGNVSRFLDYTMRNNNGSADLLVMAKTLMIAAVMLPVLEQRNKIDRHAEYIKNTQNAEAERIQQEAEDKAAHEAMLEMQETMIAGLVAKGLSPEAAKIRVESIIAPQRKANTNTGGQYTYNRVLIKCGEHEFEMGERGFHPKIAQELWEKEGITKEEFVTKYTVKVVREGTL